MIPTVSRIVHVITYGQPDKPEHRAAIITRIGNPEDNVVDLCVFNPTGLTFLQNVKMGDREGQWHWAERVEEKVKEN